MLVVGRGRWTAVIAPGQGGDVRGGAGGRVGERRGGLGVGEPGIVISGMIWQPLDSTSNSMP